MKKIKSNRLGPNGKQNRIAAEVRANIRAGKFKSGDKLPARIEFEQMYECGPVTVQNAFNKLKNDGTIMINSNKGTFVAENPPCLSTYAIVFPFAPEKMSNEISLYSTLAQLCLNKTVTKGATFQIYTNINGHKDEADYSRLLEAVMSESLSGVLFTTPPSEIVNSELYEELEKRKYLPKVAMVSESSQYPEFSSIAVPDDGFISTIFDFFQQKNIKRLAVLNALTAVDATVPYEKEIFEEADKRGVELKKYHFQSRSAQYAARSNEIINLMLSCAPDKRPDALWITNDTLVESATKGIVEAGVKVPEELIVVSHCNFPETIKTSVDTSWYGLNVCTFIETALEIMQNHSERNNQTCHKNIPIEYYLN